MSNNNFRSGIIGKSPISIGRYTYGFESITIKQWNEGAALRIGSFCSIAKGVTVFLGGNHRTDWITTFPFGTIFQDELGGQDITGHPSTKGDVIIGNDVWIGSGATIMSGIKIADGAVIAANACVVNDVTPYSIAGGNPAKIIKQRFDKEIIEILLKIKWWDLPLPTIKKISRILCTSPNQESLTKLAKTIKSRPQ